MDRAEKARFVAALQEQVNRNQRSMRRGFAKLLAAKTRAAWIAGAASVTARPTTPHGNVLLNGQRRISISRQTWRHEVLNTINPPGVPRDQIAAAIEAGYGQEKNQSSSEEHESDESDEGWQSPHEQGSSSSGRSQGSSSSKDDDDDDDDDDDNNGGGNGAGEGNGKKEGGAGDKETVGKPKNTTAPKVSTAYDDAATFRQVNRGETTESVGRHQSSDLFVPVITPVLTSALEASMPADIGGGGDLEQGKDTSTDDVATTNSGLNEGLNVWDGFGEDFARATVKISGSSSGLRRRVEELRSENAALQASFRLYHESCENQITALNTVVFDRDHALIKARRALSEKEDKIKHLRAALIAANEAVVAGQAIDGMMEKESEEEEREMDQKEEGQKKEEENEKEDTATLKEAWMDHHDDAILERLDGILGPEPSFVPQATFPLLGPQFDNGEDEEEEEEAEEADLARLISSLTQGGGGELQMVMAGLT